MTVAVAVRVPGEGAVLVSDGRVTDGGHRIVTDSCEKVRVLGSCVVMVAGQDGRSLQDLSEAGARSYADIVAYVKDRKGEEHPWMFLVWDRSSQILYGLDYDGSEIEHPNVATIGCGGDVASGVLAAMPRPKNLDEAAKQARRAVKLACLHNAACGGRIRTVVVRGRRKPLEFY